MNYKFEFDLGFDPDEEDRALIEDYLNDLAEYVPEDLLLTLGRIPGKEDS